MSLMRFVVYFCVLSGLCVAAFGQWVPHMPESDGFPIDLQGHTVPLDPVTGLVVTSSGELNMPPAPASAAVWAKVARVQPMTGAQTVTVASLPQ